MSNPTHHGRADRHYSVLVIGGGQAGLSVSYYLKQTGIDHLVVEKNTVTHTWRQQRWDAFCLVTPNWQCALPGYPYLGDDPHGFMKKDEIIDYLDGFIAHVGAPVIEHAEVKRVKQRDDGVYAIVTTQGDFTADQVVVASGGYHTPIVPRLAERLPASIVQLQSSAYRNPDALPDGAVMVVGTGQSGAQIAEDLHLAGRKVVLAVGEAPRCARFYRGRDVVDWLADMQYYDMPVEKHPLREGVRDNTNHYVTGRDGGRDIDLRKFAAEGMELYGRLDDLRDGQFHFAPTLAANLDAADDTYNRINASIDGFIEKHGIDAPVGEVYEPVWRPAEERTMLDLHTSGISAIIWCIGFTPDFSWLDAPVFNGRGYPAHTRGITPIDGLYFVGLPWLHTWGSGRFSGVARDAEFVVQAIREKTRERESVRATVAA
ncbi:MSMEG_0569 family flavin-dependent oxidoreductase [Paraburkholderia madseniana]|uniref:MSMEG_0569 family flavin-dependent oxidoreductase n=1 Tax=Paraburkholderia madseniana TaxID=2599607 RepID=A0AAP5BFM8_9BURK|nr:MULTISPECIES: MSMEG_0569 family flavin-dependent oxidoreductase [Paraburkholderia]MCX4148595.1 MSMEG_0569 family flavin-dependent oxidoreductase [Paraburkholderia madseniana]MDN7151533.1 MSMEG_0569 family flavin-dependent oxidoreductase [Paraburkholderia sp. WS6]MDQ6410413.1 MSMEG_0569 family flavin-dependent oxidoreductase [Paraburkholderia madseniana]